MGGGLYLCINNYLLIYWKINSLNDIIKSIESEKNSTKRISGDCMKVIDYLLWIMFTVSIAVGILTLTVSFGVAYRGLEMFATYKLLEASLGVTLILWGINNHCNSYTRLGKGGTAVLVSLGLIFFVFIGFRIY